MNKKIINNIVKIGLVFLLLVLFGNFCFASNRSVEKKFELFKERINLNSDVELSTLFIVLGAFLFAVIVIIVTIIFMKKMPKNVVYIIITLCVVTLIIIGILYGNELTELVNKLNELQLEGRLTYL